MLRFGIARGASLITMAPAALLAVPLVSGLGTDAFVAPAAGHGTEVGRGIVARSADAALFPPRVLCPTPRTLRLRRFEDRSAHLLCGHRVIVRISVPG